MFSSHFQHAMSYEPAACIHVMLVSKHDVEEFFFVVFQPFFKRTFTSFNNFDLFLIACAHTTIMHYQQFSLVLSMLISHY